MVNFYLHNPTSVGLIGPAKTEDEAWRELFHGDSTKAERATKKEEGWSIRTSLIPRKPCDCNNNAYCYVALHPPLPVYGG